MTKTTKLIISALFAAIGIVLPIIFHSIPQSGQILLPMHIPVLLSGFICGPVWGLLCGIITPLLSNLLTGMPPAAVLPGMICELAAYGFFAGLFYNLIHTKQQWIKVYTSLICSMLIGRVIFGVLNALIFKAGAYSLKVWLTASFVTALPGIIIQLIFIPALLLAFYKAKLIKN